MVLNMHQLSDTTNIVSTHDKHGSSVFSFNDFLNFASLKVKLISEGTVLNIILLKKH